MRNRTARIPFALLALAALGGAPTATAQNASYTQFAAGQGPSIRAVGLPRLGSTFQLEVRGCSGGAFTQHRPYLIWGVSNRVWNGVVLPWTPPSLLFGCLGNPRGVTSLIGSIYVSMDIVGPGGTSTTEIPNQPALLGTSFFNQSACFTWMSMPAIICRYTLGDAWRGVIGT